MAKIIKFQQSIPDSRASAEEPPESLQEEEVNAGKETLPQDVSLETLHRRCLWC